MHSPETRPSLILRLRDPSDSRAWNEFAEIYEPLVFRLAARMGMQPADASEATQEVMLHLSKVVETWRSEDNGSFRGWLYRVARNVMLRHLEKCRKEPRGSGDTAQLRMFRELADGSNDGDVFDLEFRRQVFAWATRKVKPEFESQSWSAFWQTFVEQQSVTETAQQLACSKGVVYIARSRVMKRLREVVQGQLNQDWVDVPFDCEPEANR